MIRGMFSTSVRANAWKIEKDPVREMFIIFAVEACKKCLSVDTFCSCEPLDEIFAPVYSTNAHLFDRKKQRACVVVDNTEPVLLYKKDTFETKDKVPF